MMDDLTKSLTKEQFAKYDKRLTEEGLTKYAVWVSERTYLIAWARSSASAKQQVFADLKAYFVYGGLKADFIERATVVKVE